MTNQESNKLWPRDKTYLDRSNHDWAKNSCLDHDFDQDILNQDYFGECRILGGMFFSTVNILNPFVVIHYNNFDRNKSISFHYDLSLKINVIDAQCIFTKNVAK